MAALIVLTALTAAQRSELLKIALASHERILAGKARKVDFWNVLAANLSGVLPGPKTLTGVRNAYHVTREQYSNLAEGTHTKYSDAAVAAVKQRNAERKDEIKAALARVRGILCDSLDDAETLRKAGYPAEKLHVMKSGRWQPAFPAKSK